ncbi:MAG: hypothetical protein LBG69_04720 [Zoogloeaceae bacterium]|jgi:hypothetical protein|nr:hypothetical protein [Zoogloeaceae bacterium]
MAKNSRPPLSRPRIAGLAARLMAEDGLADIESAKKKAARQLGGMDRAALPSDDEVEEALRLYLALYQGGETPERLRRLREAAARVMECLLPFRPCLTGAALEGTASKYSAVELLLFADSAKDVEIFLLDRQLEFYAEQPRDERAEARFCLKWPETDVYLSVFPLRVWRQGRARRDRRASVPLPLKDVLKLLESAT